MFSTRVSLFVAPVDPAPGVQPLEVSLGSGGDAFWLDARTIASTARQSVRSTSTLRSLRGRVGPFLDFFLLLGVGEPVFSVPQYRHRKYKLTTTGGAYR